VSKAAGKSVGTRLDGEEAVAHELNLLVGKLLAAARHEDLLGAGDLTSEAIIPRGLQVRGTYLAKAPGVVAGLVLLPDVFRTFCAGKDLLSFRPLVSDGTRVGAGSKLAEVRGPARSVLAAERTGLNLLCHLSGVATLTADYVARTAGTGARIYDTRKTVPGLRLLEKWAVSVGGGCNHRMGLWDSVLIKDNHLALVGTSIGDAVRKAKVRVRGLSGRRRLVEVEVTDLAGLREALAAGADIVMLDNFTPDRAAIAVKLARQLASKRGRPVEIEISGGVTLETVRAYARANPDRISVGALTHSAPAMDISLELERVS
jgi:nicotinate-nucleotide pyrophosphorylase (carboxylating)